MKSSRREADRAQTAASVDAKSGKAPQRGIAQGDGRTVGREFSAGIGEAYRRAVGPTRNRHE